MAVPLQPRCTNLNKSKKAKYDPGFGGPIPSRTDKQVYNPYHADGNILDKYRNPKKTKEREHRPRRSEKKKQNLDDSWEKAMNDEQKIDDDQFNTFKQPSVPVSEPKPEPVVNNNFEEENFNFDDMKNNLPQEENYNFDDDSSGDEGKNFDYNFVEEPNAYYGNHNDNNFSQKNYNQPKVSNQIEDQDYYAQADQNNNSQAIDDMFGDAPQTAPQSNQNYNEVDEFFGQNNSQPQAVAAPAQSNQEIDDFFGAGDAAPGQNQHSSSEPGQAQKQENIFAPDAASVFNTGGMGLNNMAGYGQNQYYGTGNQNDYYTSGYGNQQPGYPGYGNQSNMYTNQGYGNQYSTGYGQPPAPQAQPGGQSNNQGLDDLFG